MENEKKNKTRKILTWIGGITAAVVTGVVLYKKCPAVKTGVNKVMGVFSGKKKTPDFTIKPRTYTKYNKN